MLGRLSKWLRIMDCDTVYHSFYKEGMIDDLISEGRLLLSRNMQQIKKYKPSLLIKSEHVGEQIREIVQKNYLPLDKSKWFSRCMLCNVPLENVSLQRALGFVPEYITLQNTPALSFCPSCRRYFWPGTHKTKMMSQLSEWLSEFF